MEVEEDAGRAVLVSGDSVHMNIKYQEFSDH